MVFSIEQKNTTELSTPSHYGSLYKLVFIVNMSLNMGNGKVISQCMHSYDVLLENIHCSASLKSVYIRWKSEGCAKIVLKATDDDMKIIRKLLLDTTLNHSIIHDAGRTQVPSGSNTVIGIGPGPIEEIDKITGHLKLY